MRKEYDGDWAAMGLGCREEGTRGRDGAFVGQRGEEIWGWRRFGRDERINGIGIHCSIIVGVETRVYQSLMMAN